MNGQSLGVSALRGHAEELPEPGRDGLAAGAEEDVPIRRPALNRICTGMPRQPLGLPTGRGDQVDILVPVVLPRERDPLAVRTERRFGLRALIRREPTSGPSITTDDPDVVRMHEGDLGRAYRRLAKEASLSDGVGGEHTRDRH